jgi:hypothetical protein
MPAKSKNRYQNEIRAAINFAGSPAQLVSGAQPLNLDLTPETPARPAPEKAASAVPPKGRKPDALAALDDDTPF